MVRALQGMHARQMLIVAESSGEWRLVWGPGKWRSGGCVTVNSKTKQSEVIRRASEVEMNFFFNIQ